MLVPEFTANPVRYANGEVRNVNECLWSQAYGQRWGHTCSFGSRLDANYEGPGGNRWFAKELPQLGKDASDNIAVMGIVNDALWFDKSGSNYVARYFIRETLVEDTTNKEFNFTDTQGNILTFYSFDTSIPTEQRGQFKRVTDPYGNVSSATYGTTPVYKKVPVEFRPIPPPVPPLICPLTTNARKQCF